MDGDHIRSLEFRNTSTQKERKLTMQNRAECRKNEFKHDRVATRKDENKKSSLPTPQAILKTLTHSSLGSFTRAAVACNLSCASLTGDFCHAKLECGVARAGESC